MHAPSGYIQSCNVPIELLNNAESVGLDIGVLLSAPFPSVIALACMFNRRRTTFGVAQALS